MARVRFFDKRIVKIFLTTTSAVSSAISAVVLFIDIPAEWKIKLGCIFVFLLLCCYLIIWIWSKNLNSITIDVEGSDVAIKVGDIFQQNGLKAIAFNEYFDTKVDNKIISENSLNGIFINKYLNITASELNTYIKNYKFESEEEFSCNEKRLDGNKKNLKLVQFVNMKIIF